jgi:hypothetical protein
MVTKDNVQYQAFIKPHDFFFYYFSIFYSVMINKSNNQKAGELHKISHTQV